jgi:hypothetical protein
MSNNERHYAATARPAPQKTAVENYMNILQKDRLKTVIVGPFNKFLLNNLANDTKEYPNLYIGNMYKPVNAITKTIRKIHFKRFKSCHSLWYSDFYDVNDVSKVILFDSILSLQILDDIRSNFKGAKIYFYYWNVITSLSDLDIIKSKVDEIFSFDINDCQKYNLHYNSQFYFNIKGGTHLSTIYDAYFIGYDKGRYKILKQLIDTLEKCNLNFKIQIKANTSKKIKYKIPKQYRINKEIDCGTIVENAKSAKAIIDIVQKHKSGLTLRAMEALFLGKKLITNNVFIKDYDFYHKENIFILDDGNGNLHQLPDFLNKPYMKMDRNIMKKYLFENWVQNFH